MEVAAQLVRYHIAVPEMTVMRFINQTKPLFYFLNYYFDEFIY